MNFRDTICARTQTPAAKDYQTITEFAENGAAMKVTFLRQPEPGKQTLAFEMASFYDEGEHDICISTLAGCSRICTFCSVPAYRGFDAYLTPQEIALQIDYAIKIRNPDHALPNIVGMMGNGEPFGNMKLSEEERPYIFAAIERIASLPIDRMTISTVGDKPDVLQKFVAFSQTLHTPFPIKLQFSLQTPFDAERKMLVPTAKPLAQTMNVLDEYTAVSGHPVKYNIVLLSARNGNYTNATAVHARAVSRLLQTASLYDGMPVPRILKLSIYNPFPGSPFMPVSQASTQDYIKILHEHGVTAIKTFKGSGIEIDTHAHTGGFSCGQLAVTTRQSCSLD